ncbi:hypothetical protein TWF481_009133 [Arthrobotrys musiformis]|uniref:Uncharacterized protein n=1 Tax=Arthrobotrys musiformis TaxID=47236 RepID=A0AAV9W2P1_9PEZI
MTTPRLTVRPTRPSNCPITGTATPKSLRIFLELTDAEAEEITAAFVLIYQNSLYHREFDAEGGPNREAFANYIESMLNELLRVDLIAKILGVGEKRGHGAVGYAIFRLASLSRTA